MRKKIVEVNLTPRGVIESICAGYVPRWFIRTPTPL